MLVVSVQKTSEPSLEIAWRSLMLPTPPSPARLGACSVRRHADGPTRLGELGRRFGGPAPLPQAGGGREGLEDDVAQTRGGAHEGEARFFSAAEYFDAVRRVRIADQRQEPGVVGFHFRAVLLGLFVVLAVLFLFFGAFDFVALCFYRRVVAQVDRLLRVRQFLVRPPFLLSPGVSGGASGGFATGPATLISSGTVPPARAPGWGRRLILRRRSYRDAAPPLLGVVMSCREPSVFGPRVERTCVNSGLRTPSGVSVRGHRPVRHVGDRVAVFGRLDHPSLLGDGFGFRAVLVRRGDHFPSLRPSGSPTRGRDDGECLSTLRSCPVRSDATIRKS